MPIVRLVQQFQQNDMMHIIIAHAFWVSDASAPCLVLRAPPRPWRRPRRRRTAEDVTLEVQLGGFYGADLIAVGKAPVGGRAPQLPVGGAFEGRSLQGARLCWVGGWRDDLATFHVCLAQSEGAWVGLGGKYQITIRQPPFLAQVCVVNGINDRGLIFEWNQDAPAEQKASRTAELTDGGRFSRRLGEVGAHVWLTRPWFEKL